VKPVGEPPIGSPVLTAVGLAVGILLAFKELLRFVGLLVSPNTFTAAQALSTALTSRLVYRSFAA
jgi:hypothetical protein